LSEEGPHRAGRSRRARRPVLFAGCNVTARAEVPAAAHPTASRPRALEFPHSRAPRALTTLTRRRPRTLPTSSRSHGSTCENIHGTRFVQNDGRCRPSVDIGETSTSWRRKRVIPCKCHRVTRHREASCMFLLDRVSPRRAIMFHVGRPSDGDVPCQTSNPTASCVHAVITG
jgi:hypothetical protein